VQNLARISRLEEAGSTREKRAGRSGEN
jgi:hypothetical protein